MKKKYILIISVLSIIATIFVSLELLKSLFSIIINLASNEINYFDIFLLALSMLLIVFFLRSSRNFFKNLKNSPRKRAKNIAIIGMPKVGKTTFITTFITGLKDYFNNKFTVKITDSETIDILYSNLTRIKKGNNINKTSVGERRRYLFLVEKIQSTNDLSFDSDQYYIDDFAGELTNDLIESSANIENDQVTSYISWILNSDYVFIIFDMAKYCEKRYDYFIDCIGHIQSLVQKIESTSGKNNVFSDKKVMFIMNKIDIIYQKNMDIKNIKRLGYENYPEKFLEIKSAKNIDVKGSAKFTEKFKEDLKKFMKNLYPIIGNCEYSFYSSYFFVEQGNIGLDDVEEFLNE